jgi:hypothetical protein
MAKISDKPGALLDADMKMWKENVCQKRVKQLKTTG